MQAAESAAQKAKDLGKKGLVRDFGQQTGLGGSCRSSPPPPPPPPPSSPPPAWPPVQLGPLSACLPAHAALDGLQEVMEATAEEAGKKLSLNLALHDKVGAGAPAAHAPASPAELEAFGITPDFEEWVRTLTYRWGGWMCRGWMGIGGRVGRARGWVVLLSTPPSPPPPHPHPSAVARGWAGLGCTLCRCSAFRDFPAEHLLLPPAAASVADGSGDGGSNATASTSGSSGAATVTTTPVYPLNPWQLRHATLVVQALKEVNELRFVLCPK